MAIQTKTMVVKSDTALAETETTIRDTVTFDVSKLPNGITYKGLKAVLSFADPIQWNKASTYDSLTVVWDDATHASYASKRPVPQNIELTNEFYWLRTADLDAQVEMYRREVMEFDGRITANKRAIAAETARAEAAEETLQANISNKAINEMVVFGDSWTDPSFAFNTAWPFIAAQVNMKLHNYGKSGATFTNVLDNNLTSQINAFKADSSFNKSNVAIVYLFGGINDKHNNVSANDLNGKIKELASELKTICPNAQIYYSSNFDYPYTIETDFYWQTVMLGLLNHVNVINVYGLLNASAMNTGDTNESLPWYHPKAAGSYEMGAFIAQRLTGSTVILNGDYYAGYNYAGVKLTDTSGNNFKLNLLQLWKPDIIKTTATYIGFEFLPITEKSIEQLPVGTYTGTVEGRAKVLAHAVPSSTHVFKLNVHGVNGAHSNLILDITTTRNTDNDTWKDDYKVIIEDNPLDVTYITPIEFYIG